MYLYVYHSLTTNNIQCLIGSPVLDSSAIMVHGIGALVCRLAVMACLLPFGHTQCVDHRLCSEAGAVDTGRSGYRHSRALLSHTHRASSRPVRSVGASAVNIVMIADLATYKAALLCVHSAVMSTNRPSYLHFNLLLLPSTGFNSDIAMANAVRCMDKRVASNIHFKLDIIMLRVATQK